MSEPINNGELLLPVCIPESEITEILSALDLYRVLRKGGKSSVAFDAVMNALEFIDNPEDSPCLDIEAGGLGSCFRMDTSTEIFDFYPNDPFDPSDDSFTKIGGKWIRLDDILSLDILPDWVQSLIDNLGDFVGYFPNDCFVSYLDIFDALIPTSVDEFWQLFSTQDIFPFPYVTINLEGSGQAEVEFSQIPLGCSVLMVWDIEFTLQQIVDIARGETDVLDNWQLLELQRDVIGIPPELVPTTIAEIELPEDGEHVIRCYFIPSYQPDQIPFVFPFGGIREVEFCGEIKVIGSQTGTEYDRLNFRSRESVRKGFIMSTVEDICEGMLCAMETVAQRILLANSSENIVGGIELDHETGKISFPDKGASGTTGLDISARQALSGSAHRVQVGLDRFIQDIQEYYTDVGVSVQMAVLFLGAKYQASGDIITPLQAYWDYRDAAGAALAPFGVAIREHLYCSGINKSTVNTYIIDELATAKELQIQLIDILDDSQFNSWSSLGEGIPNDDYLGYACITAPVQVVEPLEKSWPPNPITYSLGGVARQYKIEFSGEMVSDTGYRFDGIYIIDPNENYTYTPTLIKQSGTTVAPSVQPAIGSNSAFYNWTKNNALQNLQVHNDSNFATLASNTLVARIYDLGIVG